MRSEVDALGIGCLLCAENERDDIRLETIGGAELLDRSLRWLSALGPLCAREHRSVLGCSCGRLISAISGGMVGLDAFRRGR